MLGLVDPTKLPPPLSTENPSGHMVVLIESHFNIYINKNIFHYGIIIINVGRLPYICNKHVHY